jgi:hypothetical protein
MNNDKMYNFFNVCGSYDYTLQKHNPNLQTIYEQIQLTTKNNNLDFINSNQLKQYSNK